MYAGRQDLADKIFWLCKPCDAWVGCKPGTDIPHGVLADEETRFERRWLHDVLDPLWKEGHMSRSEVYAWIACKLGIRDEICHAGHMSAELCREAIFVCTERLILCRAKKKKDQE